MQRTPHTSDPPRKVYYFMIVLGILYNLISLFI